MKSANFEAPQPPVLLVSDLKWLYAEILVIPLSWLGRHLGGYCAVVWLWGCSLELNIIIFAYYC